MRIGNDGHDQNNACEKRYRQKQEDSGYAKGTGFDQTEQVGGTKQYASCQGNDSKGVVPCEAGLKSGEIMKLNELSPAEGSRKKRKRVGRGPGSGHGKTACRGQKGQNSRSGGGVRPGFEGGQMPLQRRLPKRGFTNMFKREYAVINLDDLNRFPANAILDPVALREAGLVKKMKDGIKLLGNGEVSHPVVVRIHKASRTAMAKVAAVGGKVEFI